MANQYTKKAAEAAAAAKEAAAMPKRRTLVKVEIHRLNGSVDEHLFNLPAIEEGESFSVKVMPSHG